MFYQNDVSLSGFVVREPSVGKTKSGKSFCSFVIGVKNYSRAEGLPPHISYFEVETWNRLAEFCEKIIKKGKIVHVKGRLRQDRWESTDGKVHSNIKLVGKSVQLVEFPKLDETKSQQIVEAS
ncbi:MAG: single-stranded DNA-binding protein [Spirochaetes bacterium]|nr:single-stranded DNA-binding protein [Spirochaetota bacterium]